MVPGSKKEVEQVLKQKIEKKQTRKKKN
jgi:hypothetical protein